MLRKKQLHPKRNLLSTNPFPKSHKIRFQICCLFQKFDFHKQFEKPPGYFQEEPSIPQSSANVPKIVPKCLQDCSNRHQDTEKINRTELASVPNQDTSQHAPNSVARVAEDAPKKFPRCTQNAPNRCANAPKIATEYIPNPFNGPNINTRTKN